MGGGHVGIVCNIFSEVYEPLRTLGSEVSFPTERHLLFKNFEQCSVCVRAGPGGSESGLSLLECVLTMLVICVGSLPPFLLLLLLTRAQSCPALCDPMDCSPPGSPVHRIFPGKNTGVGWQFLLQGIFPTQE